MGYGRKAVVFLVVVACMLLMAWGLQHGTTL